MYLNCHSFHSLRYGTIPLDDLITQAVELNITAMALTDINTVTGIYEFIKECKKVNIKPLVGIEFRDNNQLKYIGIATHFKGVGEMNRFRTQHNFEQTLLPLKAPHFENVICIYPIDNLPETLAENEFIGITSEQLIKLYDAQLKAKISKMVILQPVTFRTKKEFNLHKILRAIDNNILLSKLTESDYCSTSEVMISEKELLEKFSDYPEIIENTLKIIDTCNVEFEFETPRNKKYYTNNQESDIALLTNLAKQGLKWRYGDYNRTSATTCGEGIKSH